MLEKKTNAGGGDTVVLLEDLPLYHLRKGDRGMVVEVYTEPTEGYDIEFIDEAGHTKALACAVTPEQIVVTWSYDQQQAVQAEEPVA